jgi:hypothetical protein
MTSGSSLGIGNQGFGMSAFINQAVRAMLRPDEKALDAAYKAARTEAWRNPLSKDWGVTETEGWPE